MGFSHDMASGHPHVIVVSSPGMGHLIPHAEFARRLTVCGFSVTLVSQTTGHPPISQQSLLNALHHQNHADAATSNLNVVSFPPPPPEIVSVDSSVDLQTAIMNTITHNFSHLRRLLHHHRSERSIAALVVDLFCVGALGIAREMGVPVYVLLTTNCMALSFGLAIKKLDTVFLDEFRHLPEPLQIPGAATDVVIDYPKFPEPLNDKSSEAYAAFLKVVECVLGADGVLVNTFQDLEHGLISALEEDEQSPPVYAVGPIVRSPSVNVDSLPPEQRRMMTWLDKQPRRSVLYVSFGSGGTLTARQTEELALGLEMSGTRFLWVVKKPNVVNSAEYFSFSDAATSEFLPAGFTKRTKEVGLVTSAWAPQADILLHAATGGFLSHCGWNSALESVAGAVPMIAWPLYADQKMNAEVLCKAAKVGLMRPETSGIGEDVVVGREELCSAVKRLMEGRDDEVNMVRARMTALRDQAVRSTGEGGSSYKALSRLVDQWRG